MPRDGRGGIIRLKGGSYASVDGGDFLVEILNETACRC